MNILKCWLACLALAVGVSAGWAQSFTAPNGTSGSSSGGSSTNQAQYAYGFRTGPATMVGRTNLMGFSTSTTVSNFAWNAGSDALTNLAAGYFYVDAGFNYYAVSNDVIKIMVATNGVLAANLIAYSDYSAASGGGAFGTNFVKVSGIVYLPANSRIQVYSDWAESAAQTVQLYLSYINAFAVNGTGSGTVDPTNAVLVNLISTLAPTNAQSFSLEASLTNKFFLNGASNIVTAVSNIPNNSVIYLSADTWNVTPSKVLSNGLGAINMFNKSNIVIQGIPGLSIISGRAAVGELLYMTNCENIVIRDVTFDGLVVTNYTLLSGIGHVWGSVGLYNVRGLKFEGNSVINAHDHGIYDLGSQPNWNTISTNRVEILRNWFHNVGSQRTNEATGFDGTAIVPTGWVIDGNTFTECLRCVEPYTENDASPNLEYRDVIRNNVAFNTLEFFLGSAGSTNTHFLTVENNTMINDWGFTRRGTNIFDTSAAISWNGGYGWKIKNNAIKGRWGYGILASSGVQDGLIAWNHIYDLTNGGSAVPIQAGLTYRTDIIGNDIRRSENQGIYLWGFRDGLVADNRIIDTAAGLGIRLLTFGGTVTSNATLRGNYIKVSTVGIQDLSGSLENISLVDNIIEEASTKYDNQSGATEWQQWTRDSADTNRVVRAHEVRNQLAAGSNITLTTDANGVTTIDASGGGSGGTNFPNVNVSFGQTNLVLSAGVRKAFYSQTNGNHGINLNLAVPESGYQVRYAVSNSGSSAITVTLYTNSVAMNAYDERSKTNVNTFTVDAAAVVDVLLEYKLPGCWFIRDVDGPQTTLAFSDGIIRDTNGANNLTVTLSTKRLTNYAHATMVTINGATDVDMTVTNDVAAGATYTISTPTIGSSGVVRFRPDGSARTIAFQCWPAAIVPLSTNRFSNVTNIDLAASKWAYWNYDIARGTNGTTNCFVWVIQVP